MSYFAKVSVQMPACGHAAGAGVQEIYVSVDIETDGPIPGLHSMLSLGAAAFGRGGQLMGCFSVNLQTLPGMSQDVRTMAWWATQPEAWAACREAPEPPEQAMPRFVAWVKALPGRPLCVAYPAAFDFPFIQFYLNEFVGENPFGYGVIDIRSHAMGVLGCDYRDTRKERLPAGCVAPLAHTHVALDDALEQGRLFCNMLSSFPGGAERP
jgi:hypothetical protein